MESVILPAEIINGLWSFNNARMAELVDAADSKSAVRKDVQVRFLFRAPNQDYSVIALFFRAIFFIIISILLLFNETHNFFHCCNYIFKL